MSVAAAATAMLCRLIILPMTPPAEFAAAISTGFSPSRLAVTTCRLPNSALADVSLPVRNTASQPSSELKKGNRTPVAAKASPSVAVAPRVVHQVRQAEHAGDREHRERQLLGAAERECRSTFETEIFSKSIAAQTGQQARGAGAR